MPVHTRSYDCDRGFANQPYERGRQRRMAPPTRAFHGVVAAPAKGATGRVLQTGSRGPRDQNGRLQTGMGVFGVGLAAKSDKHREVANVRVSAAPSKASMVVADKREGRCSLRRGPREHDRRSGRVGAHVTPRRRVVNVPREYLQKPLSTAGGDFSLRFGVVGRRRTRRCWRWGRHRPSARPFHRNGYQCSDRGGWLRRRWRRRQRWHRHGTNNGGRRWRR